jgi:hypothetical protein
VGAPEHEAFLLEEAAGWAAEGLITPEQHAAIRARYGAPAGENRRRILVRAALAIGVVLVLLGTGRLLADLRLGFLAWTGVQAVLAIASLAWGLWLRRDRPDARSAQALIYLAAMFYLGALGLGAYTFDILNRFNSPWLFLVGGTTVAALGFWVRFAKLHAIGVVLACVAAGIWLHRAGVGLLWTPVAIGLAVAAVGHVLRPRRLPQVRWLYMVGGLAVAALAAWSLELGAESGARIGYAALFTAIGGLTLAAGFNEDDDALAGMGILLLVLDVYTQYYFLLWDRVPKTAFFLVGGLITLGFGIAYERTLHGRKPTDWWEQRGQSL